jgi:hypothetical protein
VHRFHGTRIIADLKRKSSRFQAGIKTELRSHSVDEPHDVGRLANVSCSVCICKVCIGGALCLLPIHMKRIRIFSGHLWAEELEQARHDRFRIYTSLGRNCNRYLANFINVTI